MDSAHSQPGALGFSSLELGIWGRIAPLAAMQRVGNWKPNHRSCNAPPQKGACDASSQFAKWNRWTLRPSSGKLSRCAGKLRPSSGEVSRCAGKLRPSSGKVSRSVGMPEPCNWKVSQCSGMPGPRNWKLSQSVGKPGPCNGKVWQCVGKPARCNGKGQAMCLEPRTKGSSLFPVGSWDF